MLWEYLCKINYGSDRLLCELGEEGWELVTVAPNGCGDWKYIFKRPLRQLESYREAVPAYTATLGWP